MSNPMLLVRWWFWGGGYAHARRYRARGRALCGAKLHRNACYASGGIVPCPKCLDEVRLLKRTAL